MGAVPWYTSQSLVAAVQRKIAIPLNQRTFTETDILAFASEEMAISQVPDIMMFHEEYFVFAQDFPLVPNKIRYPIPERALGMKLRDVFYVDLNNNLFEMTRIDPDDKAYWQRESAVINMMQKFYLEGNELVLAPQNLNSPTGSIRMTYFLRPNQLVDDSRAAICQNFFTGITINNVVAGDILDINNTTYAVVFTPYPGNPGDNPEIVYSPYDTITSILKFTAVTGSPSALQFQIGGTPAITAQNLVNAINLDGTYNAQVVSGNNIQVNYLTQLITFDTTDTDNIVISPNLGIQFTSNIPSNIVGGINVDFLQTKPGHRTYAISVPLALGSVSTSSIVFKPGLVPSTFLAGDYIAQEYECIIPQIPPELHSGLAERVCARILSAQGDMQGYQMTMSNVSAIQKAEASLIENRVDGSTMKVTQRKSPLSFLRMGIRRRI